MKFFASDNSGCVVEFDVDSTEAAAQAYVDGGDWNLEPGDRSICVHVRVWAERDEDNLPVDPETYRIPVHAPAPRCEDPEGHDWQAPHDIVGGVAENPGVFGSSHGGVKIVEHCPSCDTLRTTDSGATDHTGQRFEAVTYTQPRVW